MCAWETRGLTEEFYQQMKRDGLSHQARHVKICLMHFTDVRGKQAWPSKRRLSDMTGLSRSSIRRALRELERKGHVKTEHLTGRRNHYSIIIRSTITSTSQCGPGNHNPALAEHTPLVSVDTVCVQSDSRSVVKDQLPIKQLKEDTSSVHTDSPSPSQQKLRERNTPEVDKLATECQNLNNWKEPNLPTGDARRRVEQALAQFGLDECLRAVVGYHRYAKRTKSSYLDFWYAFPAVRRNNFQITNQLDVSRFKAFAREGYDYKPQVAQTLDRPRSEKESDAERKRLDRYWQMHHRNALAEAKKQNKSIQESERYAKATADKKTREEIERGSVY